MQSKYPYQNSNEAYQLFHEGTLALARMEEQGVRIDVEYIINTKKKITKKIGKLENKFKNSDFYIDWKKSIKRGKEINIYSPIQLSEYLYVTLGFKKEKQTNSGQGSTDEEALRELEIPELEDYLQIKKLMKVRDTYLDAYLREQVNGTLHPFFGLLGVSTYRSSSSSPNQQNVPKRDEETMKLVRKAIYPRKGHQFLELDYGQLEVRIAACYHHDPTMVKYIKTGQDFHLDYAKEIFKIKKFNFKDKTHTTIRSATKNGFVFPQFYGDYYVNCATNLANGWCNLSKYNTWKKGQGIPFEKKNIADHLLAIGITDMESFAKHLQKIENKFWKKSFPVYDQWREDIWRFYLKHGFVESYTGFTYKGVMRRNEVINYPVQGAAFHVTLKAIILAIQAQLRERWRTKLVGETHDSILLDVYPPELKKIIDIMKCIMENDVKQHFKWITVPLEIDAELCPVDASWSEKKDYKIN